MNILYFSINFINVHQNALNFFVQQSKFKLTLKNTIQILEVPWIGEKIDSFRIA